MGFFGKGPVNLVGVFGSQFVPADVLVLADDVERIAERIVDNSLVAVGLWSEECGGDQAGGVELARFIGEVGEELGAGGVVGGLVGDRPEDDGGLVAVAADHLVEHGDVLGVDLRLVEGDVLPDGNLGPDHDAVAVGGAFHALVVGVVGEADEVGVEVFEIAEDGGDVLVVVGAAAADGGFGVHVDALQEDGACR